MPINAIVGVIAILLAAVAIRRVEGSWTAPGAFFALVWAIAAAPGLFYPQAIATATLYPVIGSFMLASLIGSRAGQFWWRGSPRVTTVAAESRSGSSAAGAALPTIVAIMSLGGWAAVAFYVVYGGVKPADLLTPGAWIELAAYYTAARYGGDVTEPPLVRLLLSSNYAGAIVGGLVVGSVGRRREKTLCFLPVAASILITVVTTAKTPALLTVLFYVSGRLAAREFRNASATRVRWRRGLVFGLMFVGFLVFALALRYGQEGFSDTEFLMTQILSYFVGHLAALSAWIKYEGLLHVQPAWGTTTLAGVAEALGGAMRQPGLYSEIGVNEFADTSNVFTALRGLIADFTWPGALMIVWLSSAIAGRAYSAARERQGSVGSAYALQVYYIVSGWSPVISVLMYNSVILAFLLAGLVLGLRYTESRRRLLAAVSPSSSSSP